MWLIYVFYQSQVEHMLFINFYYHVTLIGEVLKAIEIRLNSWNSFILKSQSF